MDPTEERHPFTVRDLHGLKRVSDLSTSPDGRLAVFCVRHWDGKVTTTSLHVLDVASGAVRPLTTKEGVADNSPRWSPDGAHLAFLSTRSGSSQVWIVPVEGSEENVQQLTQLPLDVDNLQWSPTGEYLSFSANVFLDCEADKMFEGTAERQKEADARGPNTGHVFTQTYVRHWDSLITEGKHNALFVLKLTKSETGYAAVNPALPISHGLNAAAPVPPFGGVEQYAWAPDGKEIAFTAELITRDMSWTTGWRVFTVAIDSSGPVSGTLQNIVDDITDARTQNPTYSPDGKYLAYQAMERQGYEADRLHINLYNRHDKKTSPLTHEWDRSIDAVLWSPDSQFVIANASDRAKYKLWKISVPSGQVEELVGVGHNVSPAWVNPNHLLHLQDSLTSPSNVWSLKLDTKESSRVTDINGDALRSVIMSTPSEFYFESGSDQVHAWLAKPVNFEAGKKYPLTVIIHGGPQGAWDDAWSYRWNIQNFTGHGYGVLTINFPGSTGWGQAYTDAVCGDWAGRPYEAIIRGVKHTLDQNDWIDPARVGALGASYGGFMINWIEGNAPKDMFKCLVCHAGLFNTAAFYYTTEELFFPEWEFRGSPWANPELYNKFNPAVHADKWNTPMLVIHGALDYRVPVTEGLAAFNTLQRRNVPSKLLLFPMENHWVLKPHNSIMWYDNVLAWLDQWLKQ